MAYPPRQSTTVPDGGVGLVSTGAALPLVVGVTFGGATDTLYRYTNPNRLRSEHLGGPAVELALACIQVAGGCLLLKTGASTAGANSAVVPSRRATSTGTITLAGSARLYSRAKLRIARSGALGSAKFDYTLDGGSSFTDELTVPAGGTFAVPGTAALVLTFVPGTGQVPFEAGDAHDFISVPPHYTTTNLGSAMLALLGQVGKARIRQVFFAGKNATAVAAATMAAVAATHLDTLASRDHFARGIIDAGSESGPQTQSAFSSFADDRLMVVYGDADIVSLAPFNGSGVPRVPALNAIAERCAGASLSENPGRYLSGPLRGVTAITADEYVDQQFSEGDRITTLRTYNGKSGFYCTNGFIKCPSGSDFVFYDWGRTIDEVCETVVDAQDLWILAKLRALADGTGALDPRDGVRIEAAVNSALKARILDPKNVEGFNGHVSALSYRVDLASDYLSTRTFRSTTRAVPLAPVEGIETTIGLARSV